MRSKHERTGVMCLALSRVSVVALLLSACSAEPEPTAGSAPPAPVEAPDAAGVASGTAGPAPGAAAPDGGNGPTGSDRPSEVTTGSDPQGGAAGAEPPNPSSVPADATSGMGPGIPCEVAAIVSERCAICHAREPKFSAPMPLMTAEDFAAGAPSNPADPVWSAASARVLASEAALVMPPPGTAEPLTEAERTTLSGWLMAGAETTAEGCAITEPDATTGDGAGVPVPTQGISLEPYAGWDEGVECYEFRAHDGSRREPYRVGAAVDRYVGFTFMPPWEGMRWVRSFRTLVDNAQVLHHWLFYEQAGRVQDGGVTPSVGAHPGSILMYGWAPGGDDMYYGPEVGPEMSGESGYLMEIHYNSDDLAAVDASGVEICVTDNEPAHPVTRAWLGTDAIVGTSATGTCEPTSDERIHIIAATPHMHLKGKHMKVVITRADGTEEVVHDEAFVFENQRDYAVDIWIEPGDSITTTCEFSSPAVFGTGTNQEMCYWFAQHYPAGALVDAGLIGKALHGPTTCLGL